MRFNAEGFGCFRNPCRVAKRYPATHRVANLLQIPCVICFVQNGQPIIRTNDRPRLSQLFRVRVLSQPATRPAPLLSATNQVGAQRITLDVPASIQKVNSGLNRKGLVASLIYRSTADTRMGGTPSLSVCPCEELEKLRHLRRFSWPKNEMPMVRHDALRQETHTCRRSHLKEKILSGGIVFCAFEKAHSRCAAVDDVVHEIADKERPSRHVGSVSNRSARL